MKNLLAAILILLVLTAATVINGRITMSAAEEIEQAVKLVGDDATQNTAERLDICIKLVEEKRAVLHLSLRHTHIDALRTSLEEAKACCLSGDTATMNAALAAARYRIQRWKETESFTLYNIL